MRYRVLGELEVVDGGRTLAVGGRRQQLVLAVLLAEAGARVSVDRLVDGVWGEQPPGSARKTLQAYVSRLRGVLGDGRIETVSHGYRLDATDVIDAVRFEQLADEGGRLLATAPDRALPLLREALALWRGRPWGSLGDAPVLAPSRTRLLERRLEVLEQRIEAALATGAGHGVVADLEALVADHPTRERLHRLLMLALYREGRQADALEVAHQLRNRLAEELGLEPSPGVVDLQQRILAQDPALLAAGPLGAADRNGAPARPAAHADNPYRGLHPFTEDDAEVFFGRAALVERLRERVAREACTVVVGPSGAGKSSLVRAGLLPAVRREHPSWTIATMVPGAHPFAQFEAALVRAVPHAAAGMAQQLRGDDLDVLRAALHAVAPDGRLLLVVDQLEELFLLPDQQTGDRFARALVEAVDDPHGQLTIVATVRADFVHHPLQHPTFGPVVEEDTVLVPPLRPAEIEAATVGPARRVGVGVAPELVAQVVADVASQPGALPLLQYTLTELFAARAGSPLTLAGYRDLGGLQGALARRADEIADGLDETGREAARQLFLRLVRLGDGTGDTRRRASRAELATLPLPTDLVDEVLQRFGAARLLSFDRDAVTAVPTVEVAHEALLRAWPTLRGWIDEARDDLRLQHSLSLAAAEWVDSGHDDGFLLTGSRLATFEGWCARGMVRPTGAERALLEASRHHDRTRRLDAARSLLAHAQVVAAEDPQLSLLLALHAVRMNDEAGVPIKADAVEVLHSTLQRARIPYPDGATVGSVETPRGRRGIFVLPVDELVQHARAHLERALTPAESRRFLDTDEPPAALPEGFGIGMVGEQPTSLRTAPRPLAGTQVRMFGFTFDAGDPVADAYVATLRELTGGVELLLDAEMNALDVLPTRLLTDEIDFVLLTQPSFIAEQTTSGRLRLQDVSTWVATGGMPPDLQALATVGDDGTWPAADGRLLGVPVDIHAKGVVWYRRSAFERGGYEPPSSYAELEDLVRRMVADGRTPWSLGLHGPGAAGWPASDVVGCLVLSDLGPAGYDAWVRHDLHFTHPDVRRAFERFAALFLAEGHLEGGAQQALRRPWDAPYASLLADTCMLAIGSSREPEQGLDDDIAWFAFPPASTAAHDTMLLGGLYVLTLTDRPEVRVMLDMMASPAAKIARAEAGGAIMPTRAGELVDMLPLEGCVRELARAVDRALRTGRFRFDAKDCMPAPVRRTFNAGMVEITRDGPRAIDRVLSGIDRAWEATVSLR